VGFEGFGIASYIEWREIHVTTRKPVDIEPELRKAAEEFTGLKTAQDVRSWWSKYYYTLGHRRLGRLLLGQPLDRLLERSQRGQKE
jgi:hypothetical protein